MQTHKRTVVLLVALLSAGVIAVQTVRTLSLEGRAIGMESFEAPAEDFQLWKVPLLWWLPFFDFTTDETPPENDSVTPIIDEDPLFMNVPFVDEVPLDFATSSEVPQFWNPIATPPPDDIQLWNPIPGPPPPPEPISCFICQYQEFTQCEAANDRATCIDITVPGYGKECRWRTPAGEQQPRCVSWLRRYCEEKMTENEDEYDETCMTGRPLVTDPARPLQPGECRFSSNCNPMDYFYEGHSGTNQCGELFQMIMACIDMSQLSSDQVLELNFINDGCSTFANAEQVQARAEILQREIDNRRLPFRVIARATGHQATASDICLTPWTIEISPGGITSTFGPCHYGSAADRQCYQEGESNWCTDPNGNTLTETCCYVGPLGNGEYTAWEQGENCDNASWFNSCRGLAAGGRCDPTLPQIAACLAQVTTNCRNLGRTMAPVNCEIRRGFCECDWECLRRPTVR